MADEISLLERQKSSSKDSATWLYLDLMKRSLVNWLYMDHQLKHSSDVRLAKQHLSNVQYTRWRLGLIKQSLRSWISRYQQPTPTSSLGRMKQRVVNWLYLALRPNPSDADLDEKAFDPRIRSEGLDWPTNAHTMIGLKRLDNIQFCVEDVLTNDVPGDLIETGVWRGGATIFMRAILKVYGVHNRTVWVADSFEGLPPPNTEKYPYDAEDVLYTCNQLAIPVEQVKENFERYGLLDDQVRFLKGWFNQTLPTAPLEKLAVIRLDGDMYESTMDALVSLYPKLSVGGYVIVDDYSNEGTPACRQAVDDYRKLHSITDEIVRVDWTGVYWQRT